MLRNQKVGENQFHLTLGSANITSVSKPGQFVEIMVSVSDDPLLRRPIGIHRVKKDTFDILVEAVGRATSILSAKKPGEYVDVIGPLGNGFSYEPGAVSQELILVAGGMGVAPLVYLAETLVAKAVLSKTKPIQRGQGCKARSKPVVLIGAKSKSHILCEKEFAALGYQVKVATDDGSKGFKGRVTELLSHELKATSHGQRSICACGPKPMLKALSQIAAEQEIPAQISLEAHMACGIGACLGCVVKIANSEDRPPKIPGFVEDNNRQDDFEYKRVCKDGPVFAANQVIWD